MRFTADSPLDSVAPFAVPSTPLVSPEVYCSQTAEAEVGKHQRGYDIHNLKLLAAKDFPNSGAFCAPCGGAASAGLDSAGTNRGAGCRP